MIRDPWLKALIIVMVAIASLYLVSLIWQGLSQFSDVLLLFLLAWVLAFVLEPLVRALGRSTPLPRSFSVSLIYLCLLLALSAGVVLVIPVLVFQISELANQLPSFIAAIERELRAAQATLAARGIEVDLARSLGYPEWLRRAEAAGPEMLTNLVGLATGAATLLVQIGLVVILSFYMMLDGHRITRWVTLALPERARGDIEFFFASVNQAFAGFLRGQLLQGVLNGAGTAMIMAATGLDLVLLVSLASGLIIIFPFIGPPLSMIPPIALAYFTKPEVFWLVAGLMLGLQQIVVNVVAPRVVGSMVGLHPLLVFFAVLAGAKLAGVWGVIFGIPILAVIAAMFSFYRSALEKRQLVSKTESQTEPRQADIPDSAPEKEEATIP